MSRIEKTVFLSYRRTNASWALAIFQNLTHHGYDVFFDFSGIASGDFERVILGNILASAHFIVLLTPPALERCGDPGDWLRREIETALDSQRNIVPLMLDGFDFETSNIARQLSGRLEGLKRYNALHVPAQYFAEAMVRLREKYLNVSLGAVLHPASPDVRDAAKAQRFAASSAPLVEERELTVKEFPRSRAMRASLQRARIFNEKPIRDLLFEVIKGIVARQPLQLSKLQRQLADQSFPNGGFKDKAKWDAQVFFFCRLLLLSGCLYGPDGMVISRGPAANGTEVTTISPTLEDTAEGYLVEYIIQKLRNVTEFEHCPLALAVFRQFDSAVELGTLKDRVQFLIGKFADKLTLSEIGMYIHKGVEDDGHL
jgi:hypothetical protein